MEGFSSPPSSSDLDGSEEPDGGSVATDLDLDIRDRSAAPPPLANLMTYLIHISRSRQETAVIGSQNDIGAGRVMILDLVSMEIVVSACSLKVTVPDLTVFLDLSEARARRDFPPALADGWLTIFSTATGSDGDSIALMRC